MYINYSKLWKFLAEKELTRSDLMALTGLSSRVIAKLAKNKTVTTDTIAKICTVLSCDVGDIMECCDESSLSFYNYFRSFGELVFENEHVKKFSFSYNGQKYAVYITKKAATKSTHIYCEKDGALYSKQHYIMGGMCTPTVETNVLVKPTREIDEITIAVIKGKPGVIIGLDEGIWVSAANGKLRTDNDIFVMSEAVFKVFAPEK